MPITKEEEGVVYTTPFKAGSRARTLCLQAVRELNAAPARPDDGDNPLGRIKARLLATAHEAGDQSQRVRFIISLLFDLRCQGWEISVRGKAIHILRPDLADKASMRASLAVARDKQLQQPAARAFIEKMQRSRPWNQKWVSIFDLMRDGRELGEKLRAAAQKIGEERVAALRQTIDPYIQIVKTGVVCERTGFELSDIWRYFRHTWATVYSSSVGRELKVLIRDRATPHHAVIGIATMVSPRHLVHVDRWVGWEKRNFLTQLDENPTASWAKWIDKSLTELIGDLHVDDFVTDRLIRQTQIAKPTKDVIGRLEKEAEEERAAHRLYPEQGTHKGDTEETGDADWTARTQTHLYRGNRAAALAELLRARLNLREVGFTEATAAALTDALKVASGRDAIGTVLKYVKARHAGINVLDISVCGAVAPYSPIIGGKLVAMLLTSPEIGKAYESAYRKSPSIIASSMAGRPIIRAPHLVMLTTSSLYGDPLNQYTRANVPAEDVGGERGECVRYTELGQTIGKGSHHISGDTVDEAEVLLTQRADGHRVNSIFGEGVNPRLRKIRSALDLCQFKPEYILEHGSPRVLYGVGLATNFRDVLLGRCKTPKYALPDAEPEQTTRMIAAYWMRRWLAGRIDKPHVIEQVETHTLAHPMTHGARVTLPPLESIEPSLFDAYGD